MGYAAPDDARTLVIVRSCLPGALAPGSGVIRVFVGVPEAFVRRAAYVFNIFSERWGVPVSLSHDPSADADLTYSTDAHQRPHGAVHIPFDERLYDAKCSCAATVADGFHVWSQPDADPHLTDLVASTYRLLTLLDEQHVAPEARDRWGIFRTEALPSARERVTGVPIVDEQAMWLLARLRQAHPGAVGAPPTKWPGGKRYAVALTHDTDEITLGAGRELLTNLAKSLIRRDRARARMFADGLQYVGKPMENPLFGFPRWRDVERSLGLRSAFYLFARVGSLRADLHDCKSSVVDQRIDWRVLREMATDGWEFGLHAPIHAKDHVDAFTASKRWIEGQLGTPIPGLRHHYFALDWISPPTTFRKHVESGFRYDTSIAWKDVSGFRAATCHPYRPFDSTRDQALDLYEVPTCVMDGHVLEGGADVSTATETALRTIARVKACGGAAVLNWHTESACGAYVYRDHMTTLDGILASLMDDDDAWFATPWEIVQHWHRSGAAWTQQSGTLSCGRTPPGSSDGPRNFVGRA